jgi:haloalkane dehalogenase
MENTEWTIIRTPEDAFAGLQDYPFDPNYLEWDGLRTHYLDEGPEEGPVALLLHGEPTWSYLYRNMIPKLVEAGYRCIAPDHIGFGKSDKVVEDDWHTIHAHIDRLSAFLERLDLRRITLFCQDWGGPIGLVTATENRHRFERLAILNTWLHHEDYAYSDALKMWRASATHPWWLLWTDGRLPCGPIVASTLRNTPEDVGSIIAAYEAPFQGDGNDQAGPRRFPWCLPFEQPKEGAADRQADAFEVLSRWDIPKNLIFGTSDPIFTEAWGREWAACLPDATFDSIPSAGHFVQEDAAPEVVETFLRHAI